MGDNMQDPEAEFKSRFGSKVASDLYARLKKISTEAKVLKVYEVERTDTEVRMKIFNSWMMTRVIDTGAVAAFERDYASGTWSPVEPHGIFHIIPIWPIVNLRKGIEGGAKQAILEKLYAAVGLREALERADSLRRGEEIRLMEAGVERDEAYGLANQRFPDGRAIEIARHAFADRLFGSRFTKGNRKPQKGYVGQQAVYNALKGVRAEFFRQFRDAELFRSMIAMERKYMTLGDYIYFAANREAVLKVWRERRNLVPLLPHIGRAYWGSDELFSAANWTNPHGPLSEHGFTAIQVRNLPSQNAGSGVFSPFTSVRAYQWLSRARSTVVKEWVKNGKDPRIADLMSELNLPKGTAVLVIAKIVAEMEDVMRKLHQAGFALDEYRQRILRTFRAYATHWASLRREKQWGYRGMVRELFYVTTGQEFDYLIHVGFAQNLPARNATWASIQRRSEEWHDQERQRYRARFPYMPAAEATFDQVEWDGESQLPQEWTSLVPEQTIGVCQVSPIGSWTELTKEGGEMSHCVGSYASSCARDRYRVYSITEPDGTRATLGISLYQGSAFLDQVQGYRNSRPSEQVQRVAEEIVSRYASGLASVAADVQEAA
jgi:hypothetical protein